MQQRDIIMLSTAPKIRPMRSLRDLIRDQLGFRRGLIIGGIAIVLAGLALGWNWLSAIGVAPLILSLAFSIGADALRDYQLSLTQSAAAGRYLDLGAEIDSSLPPDASVLGPERWWWALHSHPYLSLRNLWFQWTASARNGRTPEFVDLVARAQANTVIVNDNVRGDLVDFPDTVQQQFWTFIDTCTQRVADLDDPTYLEIEVYVIFQPSPRPEVCSPLP